MKLLRLLAALAFATAALIGAAVAQPAVTNIFPLPGVPAGIQGVVTICWNGTALAVCAGSGGGGGSVTQGTTPWVVGQSNAALLNATVTIADGADKTLGAQGDTACANSTSSCSLDALAKAILGAVQGPVPTQAGTVPIGGTTPLPVASGGLSIKRLLVANNTTSIAVDASPGQLYETEAFNNSATPAYIKYYNAAQGSVTCGSGTPIWTTMIPGNGSGGTGYIRTSAFGYAFSTALTACVTTGYADNDTTAPAASTYIVNWWFK